MPRFNFNTLALSNAADIEKVQENFEEIEQNAAKLSDLGNYQTLANQTTTINAQSTNTTYPGTKAVYDNLGIIRYGGKLSIANGSVPNLQNAKYYYITGLSVNGVNDGDFSYSIIYYWTSGSNLFIDLVDKYTMYGNDVCFGKRYEYDAATATWSVVYERRLQYSTTDLTAGSSPLSTGSLYFVYE